MTISDSTNAKDGMEISQSSIGDDMVVCEVATAIALFVIASITGAAAWWIAFAGCLLILVITVIALNRNANEGVS